MLICEEMLLLFGMSQHLHFLRKKTFHCATQGCLRWWTVLFGC